MIQTSYSAGYFVFLPMMQHFQIITVMTYSGLAWLDFFTMTTVKK